MQHVQPIMVIDLFPRERKQLLELFSELEPEEWEEPTICPGWTVKDIGLHLLGDDVGYLSGARDHFSNPFFRNKDLREWKSLVKNLNEANELWVQAAAQKMKIVEFPVPLIYLEEERSFGGSLDVAAKRLAYYQEVLDREMASLRLTHPKKCDSSSGSEQRSRVCCSH